MGLTMQSILDTKIQYFEGKIWKTSPLGKVTLKQFIQSHKDPKEKIKKVFNKIAEAERNKDWETKGKLKQENLYYFTPCVNLDGSGRSYENIESFNGLLVLDFDHLEINADEFRDRLFNAYKWIACAYKSPSGNGVKTIVNIPQVNTVEQFKEYFYAIAYKMEKVKSFDVSCANPVLPLFFSWDENIKWREKPEIFTQRGGKHNEFRAYTGDFEEIDDVTDADKKEVLTKAYNVIKRADEDNTGHPNVKSSAILIGGYVSSGYLTYDEAENYIFKWIEESPYLSAKENTYKKTAKAMITKGTSAPLYLNRHQDKKPLEIKEREEKEVKNKRKYFLYCNLTPPLEVKRVNSFKFAKK